MKKIFALLLSAALCLGFAACAAKDAPDGAGEPAPAPAVPAPIEPAAPAAADPAPISQPAAPEEPEPDYALFISDQPIPAVEGCLVTDRLPVRFINNTGEDGYVLDIPHLERLSDAGEWEAVPYKEGIGFCGTPSTLPAEGRDWSEEISMLWGALEDGAYRLSYEVGATFKTEEMVYGEFTLYTPEDNHGLPLAESLQAEE